MKIPPSYTVTAEMVGLIAEIEAIRIYLVSLKPQKPIKEKIERVNLLKSSLFSARIEGNPIELSDLELGRQTEQKKKKEIFNILDAAGFIEKKIKSNKITIDILLQIHECVMKDISLDAGYFRKEVSAIFNKAGVAVYMPPPPSEVSSLLNKLLVYVNLDKEKFPLVGAYVAHLVFEKIHPFLDGNGRVGRLLITAILKARKWDVIFSIPFEEYLDIHKDEYYFYLDTGLQKTNDYLLFMLTAFLEELKKIRLQIEEEIEKKEQVFLPPRQEEIYKIIQDHVIASFDIIRRRFLRIPERTLRYDLQKLLKLKIIEKSGETRGRYYRVRKQK